MRRLATRTWRKDKGNETPIKKCAARKSMEMGTGKAVQQGRSGR